MHSVNHDRCRGGCEVELEPHGDPSTRLNDIGEAVAMAMTVKVMVQLWLVEQRSKQHDAVAAGLASDNEIETAILGRVVKEGVRLDGDAVCWW